MRAGAIARFSKLARVDAHKAERALGTSGIFGAMCLAEETGGQYYSTETADELAAALEKVLACPLLSDAR